MLWTSNYKKGPAPLQGCWEATTEELAYKVREEWAKQNNVKVFGRLEPWILADESILGPVDVFAGMDKPEPKGVVARVVEAIRS